MSSSGKKHPFMVSPPPMFTYLDNKMSCCFGPLSKANISFFKSVGIDKIFNYSGKKLDSSLSENCSSININVQEININDQDFPKSSIRKFNEWITIQVVDLIRQSYTHSVVIFGSVDNHISSLIIACIRKQYDWSLISIFAEFRQFTWPYKMRDYEQLIEHYTPTVIDTIMSTTADESLSSSKKMHFDEEEEESRKECEVASGSPVEDAISDEPRTEMSILNDVLRRLLVHSSNTILISENVSFDPAISLVNDKDDDD